MVVLPQATLGSAVDCPDPEIQTTTPSPVDADTILKKLTAATTDQHKLAFDLDANALQEIRSTLMGGQVKTKMEQFYTTLFILQNHSPLTRGITHVIPGKELREALLLSGIFPDATLPDQIESIRLRPSSLTPMYEVYFKSPEVLLPLNKGRGFRTWQHGKCQEARSIIFTSPFRFYIKRLDNGNLRVYKFQNVQIEGDFGTRGIMDVDINYVQLLAVTFIRNTPLGYVQARVAEREFATNRHSWILKVITSFFSDTTKQAIDW